MVGLCLRFAEVFRQRILHRVSRWRRRPWKRRSLQPPDEAVLEAALINSIFFSYFCSKFSFLNMLHCSSRCRLLSKIQLNYGPWQNIFRNPKKLAAPLTPNSLTIIGRTKRARGEERRISHNKSSLPRGRFHLASSLI